MVLKYLHKSNDFSQRSKWEVYLLSKLLQIRMWLEKGFESLFWCSSTFLILKIAPKRLNGRCMCLEKALSSCFNVLILFVILSCNSKRLNDCFMCLANLDRRRMWLEKALSPYLSALILFISIWCLIPED